MKKIAFYDTKPYDREWFDRFAEDYKIKYYESRLNAETAKLAQGCDAACVFVNDDVSAEAVDGLCEAGVRVIALRCAGYSNVDLKAAEGRLRLVRVPAYSPYAVAEHAMALLLSVNRKLHRAYNRTRDFNFSLAGLCGSVLHGKCAGVIGTGRIGRCFIEICRGFGMRVLAFDPFPSEGFGIEYTELDRLFGEADVISLHCPLTPATRRILDERAFARMKRGVFIINTSRGELVDSQSLLAALDSGVVGGAGLDVYEEEAELFFEDLSSEIVRDDVLALLISRPNVLITSHQAFLTSEALENIAAVTIENLNEFFGGRPLTNEVALH